MRRFIIVNAVGIGLLLSVSLLFSGSFDRAGEIEEAVGGEMREPLPSRQSGLHEAPATPFAIIENRGQWPCEEQFVADWGGVTARFAPDRMLLQRAEPAGDSPRGVLVSFSFEGASESVVLEGERPLPGQYNFFQSRDPGSWRTGVSGYAAIRYRELYSGIDVIVRQGEVGFEYDLRLEPGRDLEDVVIRCDGAQSLEVRADGSLALQTEIGPILQKPPVTWFESVSGERERVDCRYRRVDERRFGFAVERTDATGTLVIDPGLEWSTFLGGKTRDEVLGVDVDSQGGVVAVGFTGGRGFPTTPGAFDTDAHDNGNAFITRFDPSGQSLVFSTYLGTESWATGVVVGPGDEITVCGEAGFSADFPTTPGAYDRTWDFHDTFVSRLNAVGSTLIYSTFLGGSSGEEAWSLDLDAAGNAAIAGITNSIDFPTTPGAFDRTHNLGAGDAYVSVLDATGSTLLYSTFLGGSGSEAATGVAFDDSGHVIAVGSTASPNFPVTAGAFDRTFEGNWAVFVTRIDPTTAPLVYSTFLSGSVGELGESLCVDQHGQVTVTGETLSPDFPTTPGAFDTVFNGGREDAFVTRLDATGSSLVFSTFLGGTGSDRGKRVLLDSDGSVVVAGRTRSVDFPVVPGSYRLTHPSAGGGYVSFVTHLDATGQELIYSTYIGSTLEDQIYAAHLDSDGVVTIGGFTWGPDFPVTENAFDPTYNETNNWWDAFLARVPLGPIVRLNGVPATGNPVSFSIHSVPRSQAGQVAQVVLSCSGDAGIPLPGGETLPLTLDPCVLWTLRQGFLFRSVVDAQGKATTPTITLPKLPSGLTLTSAAVVFHPSTGAISSVSCPMAFQSQ